MSNRSLSFDWNFTEIYCQWSNLQGASIGSDDGLAYNMRHALIWTNDSIVYLRIYASLGLNYLSTNLHYKDAIWAQWRSVSPAGRLTVCSTMSSGSQLSGFPYNWRFVRGITQSTGCVTKSQQCTNDHGNSFVKKPASRLMILSTANGRNDVFFQVNIFVLYIVLSVQINFFYTQNHQDKYLIYMYIYIYISIIITRFQFLTSANYCICGR